MKKLILILTVLLSVQLSASAQNQNTSAQDLENKRIDAARIANQGMQTTQTAPKAVVKKVVESQKISEAQVLTNMISKDVVNRTKILSSSKELKAALTKTFGDNLSLSSKSVVAQILKIAGDKNQSILIRQEALTVLHGKIPDGQILEENK